MKYLNLIIILLCGVIEIVMLDYQLGIEPRTIFFVLKYLLILFLVISGKNNYRTRSNLITWGIVVASYLPVLFLRPLGFHLPIWFYFISFANYLFYSFLVISAYIYLGRSIGLVPEIKQIKQDGPYKVTRHPIYFFSVLLITNFLACNFNALNFFLWLCSISLLFLRAYSEERFLAESADYRRYLVNTSFITLRAVGIALPALILLSISIVFKFLEQKKYPASISYATDVKFYSLDPTKYDDWTSAFIANHILARLIDDRTDNPTNALCEEIKRECVTSIDKCERVKVELACKEIIGCSGQKLTLDKIKDEFAVILSKKSWLLPNHKLCKSNKGLCVEFDTVENIKERFSSIYFRFGWSEINNTKTSNYFGFGSHCTKLSKLLDPENQSHQLESRTMELPSVSITSSASDQSDIYSYENTNAKKKYQKLVINTPVAYYVVTNDKLSFNDLDWNSQESLQIIRDHLIKQQFIFKSKLPFNAVPRGRDSIEFKLKTRSNVNRRFILPSFISSCDELANKLSATWKADGSRSRAICADLNETIQDTVLKRKKWDGFLSPLTPGAPYKDSIHDQYFSSDSNDRWIKNTSNNLSYYLVGMGPTPLYVDQNIICGVRDFYLGLSDLHISDFKFCY